MGQPPGHAVVPVLHRQDHSAREPKQSSEQGALLRALVLGARHETQPVVGPAFQVCLGQPALLSLIVAQLSIKHQRKGRPARMGCVKQVHGEVGAQPAV